MGITHMAVRQLEIAMAKASALAAERQVALAALILEEIASEDHWDARFAGSQEKLAAMADEALAEDSRGETLPLDDTIS
jgi:hypothetical protein